MSKIKTTFFCQKCGTPHAKWQGQCNGCKEWNTLVEEVVEKPKEKGWSEPKTQKLKGTSPIRIQEIETDKETRITSNDSELDRVLGGGLVPGSVTLLGGEPGIGKSTLLLQISLQIKGKVLYVSGEESQKQIKLRAERIESKNENCFVLSETQTQKVFKQIELLQPDIVIIDSIQTLQTQYVDSSPGSVSQIKECTSELIQFAKKTNTPVLLVGHITKDGAIAGPKVLEHMVDTVLHFEGDRNHIYRIIRAQKNRFGSTAEIGIYEMLSTGLRIVTNPSELLISQTEREMSGHAIAATMEGVRPLMIEVQALVSTAVYGTPQRSTTGFNAKRLNMLLAVLEKRAGFQLGSKDVFLNITGGISIEDPAIDLAVVSAILSSYHDIALPKEICFAAEIGLSGELRPVAKLDQRITEAEKLGFETIVSSKGAKNKVVTQGINSLSLTKIEEVIALLFA
ncbi:DNA repair protein RadA [Flavobacteriaceae bacterium]|uniref:DNA repair protein RadA n=1 Tax=Candidatus Arcticimaribacter forsetii TaxID=2820661 RepID=UPI0020779954|nr:DNA repair protein RadA [Candidatus Arcticimaribacter forsetii]MDA8698537.1 DNA repair protein RadA [Flavobacteriaceae bacterium]MDB2325768.1 DNA repair protein RadA [Flavobacteriaceae bacterium]MDB2329113.1 DNA repair protein RadA [Flavobacteriaceae bacterium]MDB4716719.1 DNA repair protein RadA [Flavobacteriaceae bacterium]